ncbi:MAG: MBL fold metallo-hydrolase [Lysinibacillus sp.]
MRINNRIHLIGSGDYGFNLTNKYDCNIYLIDGGNSLALIDAGAGIETERIINEIKDAGFDPLQVDFIFLTHAHADHAGGAYELSKQCDAVLYGLADTARFVSTGDTEAISLSAAIKAGIYPSNYHFPSCPVTPINDGEKFQVGDLKIHAIETLGHSDGHASYYMEYAGKRCLFGGDLIFGGGKISLQATWDCRLTEYEQSIRKVSELKIDSLFPGHFIFICNDAHHHIETAVSQLNQLAIPKNI